jgi:2-(1,2-epoxy-1,2-dihydrophenyl)acetyl-CoA isomerase
MENAEQPHFEQIRLDAHDGVAFITLNRPDKINSLTIQMHRELRAAIDLVERDHMHRVLILAGSGRGFCAGQDLADPETNLDRIGEILDQHYNALVMRLRQLPIPVIAAVHGVAAGAGASIALAADLTLAERNTRLTQAFVRIGLLPDAGGTWFLARRLGQQRAMGLALTGETITGEQAEHMGLIWRACDDGTVHAQALALAQHLRGLPRQALAEIKQAIQQAADNRLEEQLQVERSAQVRLGATEDFAEGIAAFRDKRPPRFRP